MKKIILFFTLFLPFILTAQNVQVFEVAIKGTNVYHPDGRFVFDQQNLTLNNIQGRKWLPWAILAIDPATGSIVQGYHATYHTGDLLTAATGQGFQAMLNFQRPAQASNLYNANGITHVDHTHNNVWFTGDLDGQTPAGGAKNSLEVFGISPPPQGQVYHIALYVYALP